MRITSPISLTPSRVLAALAALHSLPAVAAAQAPEGPSVRYEVSINGEHFTVDGDRVTKLKSAEDPKVTYEVAVRLSPVQRWTLNQARFDYDKGFSVSDDLKSPVRTVTLKHGLGFVMTVSDMGGALKPADQQKNLTELADGLAKSYRDAKSTLVEVSKPQTTTLGKNNASGVEIRYVDADDIAHVTLAYFISGESFTCSCLVQCLDVDYDDVMPLVRPTLESFAPRPAKPAAARAKAGKK